MIKPAWRWNSEDDTLLQCYRNRAVGAGLCGVVTIDDRGRAAEDAAGGFEWIRRANDKVDRHDRQRLSDLTSRVVDCRGYVVRNSHTVPLQHVHHMLAGTRVISPSCGEWPELTSACVPLMLQEVQDVVPHAAVARCSTGRRVVAVNAAAAYHAGGGFSTGGRHALEEAFCVQSTLYASLAMTQRGAVHEVPSWVRPAVRYDGSQWASHIPNDGVILSPSVEFFRSGTNEGYAFEDEAVSVDVVSVAMPNCNTSMTDTPVDRHPEHKGYLSQLKQKWRAVVVAAGCTDADCLVVPDAGCGVFLNSPVVVGAMLGEVLREGAGQITEVLVVHPGTAPGGSFFKAVKASLAGVMTDELKQALADPTLAPQKVVPAAARTQCKYGSTCYRRDPVHRANFWHPGDPEAVTCRKEPCKYGASCRNKNRSHAGRFSHPEGTYSIWEYSVQNGWEAFDSQAQIITEASWRSFQEGGTPTLAKVPCRDNILLIDFQTMTQRMEGSTKTRKVQRFLQDRKSVV